MFQRFFDEGLAQSSYLIACERTRDAIVIDPRRDIDAYVAAASQQQLRIAYAIETHIHADFVSGARELAALGATVIAGPGADLQFPFQEGRDRETLHVGDITVELLHTPGHTPEHISLLVREPDRPVRALTGDTLFVGAVGRPDLLGPDQARELAGQLYHSLFDILLGLDDAIEVHPGHGAGSLCGSGIGDAPHSLIGQERRFNPLLQQRSKDAFVAAVLGDLPETPPYFPQMKRVNRAGPPVLGLGNGVPPPRPLRPADAAAMVEDGAVLVDMRSADAFGAGHPSGAINIGFGSKMGYWAGWMVPLAAQIILLGSDSRQALEARRQLTRVGFENVAGSVDGGYQAWSGAGCSISRVAQVSPSELRSRLARSEPLTLVDVRTAREWRAGHLDEAVSIPVGEITRRAGELRGVGTVATMCEGGFRSSLAASLLKRAGVDVVNVTGGLNAYRALESTS
jgi:hydroxyacylglutathione hydrolase